MKTVRVLVVDDEDEFRETLIKRLQSRSLTVAGAENGAVALKLLGEQDFDVVVLDIKMPQMDGLEFLEKLKGLNQDLGVILLTGHGSVESGMKGLGLGALEYLMKPVPVEELLDKIRSVFEEKTRKARLESQAH
ncbi:MAG: response regulator [Deltaproteobacteria bacterium]|nr:response regulator [Deltaproteobacteria bacterium]